MRSLYVNNSPPLPIHPSNINRISAATNLQHPFLRTRKLFTASALCSPAADRRSSCAPQACAPSPHARSRCAAAISRHACGQSNAVAHCNHHARYSDRHIIHFTFRLLSNLTRSETEVLSACASSADCAALLCEYHPTITPTKHNAPLLCSLHLFSNSS